MTNKPILYSITIAAIIGFTSAVFIIYTCLARRKQGVLMENLARSSAIVRSLFPATVRDRMLNDTERKLKNKRGMLMLLMDGLVRQRSVSGHPPGSPMKLKLGSFLKGSRECYSRTEENGPRSTTLQPIADLFPHTTVMFADIAGFTAWSSDREPPEVFQLLETVWAAFDAAAKRLGVYKIETVGDCYACVTGLPDANEDHALIMTRFAYECLHRIKEILQKLEVSLGPGTTDLAMRFGLHSGPVTAGVLRGEKARFQLFGDTMNTAAQMKALGKEIKFIFLRQPLLSSLMVEWSIGLCQERI
jgi:class 3 adenylate cyclase